jgi:hypothetical protein
VLFRNDNGDAIVRLIAGDVAGVHGPGNTHTPIIYAHATLQPGAHLALDWPREFNALVYVLSGNGRVGGENGRAVGDGQVAALGAGGAVVVDADAPADAPLEVLLLGGRPIREPVFSYGPFVMNTKQEIIEALDDFEAGKMGSIPPRGECRATRGSVRSYVDVETVFAFSHLRRSLTVVRLTTGPKPTSPTRTKATKEINGVSLITLAMSPQRIPHKPPTHSE